MCAGIHSKKVRALKLFPIAAVLGLGILSTTSALAQQISGADTTFPEPLFQRWGETAKAAIGLEVNDQAIGAGGGLNRVRNRTADFGASDMPLSAEDIEKGRLEQFPTAMGAIVLIVNVPGDPRTRR